MARVTFHLLLWLAIFGLILSAGLWGGSIPAVAEWMDTAVIIYVLFFSVVIHELSHGLAAYYCGDDTARNAGRLSLNPVHHVSVVGTIVVPLVLYFLNPQLVLGWAKPVPLNPLKLRHYPRDQIFAVMAGPLANFLMVFLGFITFAGLGLAYLYLYPDTNGDILFMLVQDPPVAETSQLVWQMVLKVFFNGIIINLVLGVFNLIPIPPLDGSWILKALLPQKARQYMTKYALVGLLVFILILKTGWFNIFMFPVNNMVVLYHYLTALIFM